MIVTPHILEASYWCLGNLRRHFRPFGYESAGAFRQRLQLGQGGTVPAGAKRINALDMKRRSGVLLKPAA
jgi:hypothetical protein